MRFGNCLDLVAPANGGSRRILDLTVKAGFDFVEPSLMSLARASEAEFAAVQRLAGELSLCLSNAVSSSGLFISVIIPYLI